MATEVGPSPATGRAGAGGDPYYWDTNPGMIRQASHALQQVLADSFN